ncbi:MAG: hypothetical protein A3E98_03125 [Candidatus Doudnabacteria bacterium RIFCSPHIGHO2_12_FULL_48_11]|uniref:Serine aminopeptidase S33 domain-containing protein n=1 Tax=Candidatus Doudnabacteria bacterium RIFCSPHIGHO2_01_FULL_46_24 TaxID=1817825 RepID=A0A1F5NWA5_9BACT|nr:MAG: hypothetical protein A2720_03255 [Candidatus Doudnabacteria bacterium RIFCSPHIGHO2_01_FULL_46_24]OGE96032.1 MAG: hypothetical protein A3E98_03125 [Candidatus Doudnabacteria bacterium RIFCSPHIGHO2_12_FULL_48_11]
MKHWTFLILRTAILTYFGLGLILFFMQNKYIYFPTNQDFYDCPGFEDAEKVNWQGTRMYVKQKTDRWIVMYHGNAGSACDRSYLKLEFEKLGYSYIFVEYAGYSNDNLEPSHEKLVKNVDAVIDYLGQFKPTSVAVLGESLGTALASYHAATAKVDKLLLIAAFNNLSDLAAYHYKVYQVKLLLRDKFPAEEWLAEAENVLFIHGAEDDIIPVEFGRRFYQGIKAGQKQFVEITGAGHNDIYDFSQTYEAIENYLK